MHQTVRTLWCDGLSVGGNKKHNLLHESESDDDTPVQYTKKIRKSAKHREEEVQDAVDYLQKKHGCNYTTMQFRK